jgi:gamma-glutamylputrescine oxidase
MRSHGEERSFHLKPDLAVIGAGIVGLFAALFHQRRHPHHLVMVMERGAFPRGGTVRNAGFACFGSPSELLHDIDADGEDIALSLAEERWKGLLELRAELGDERIGFEPTGGHEAYRAGDARYTQVAEGFERLNQMLRPITGRAPSIGQRN